MSVEDEIARLRRVQATQAAAAQHDASVRAEGAERLRARMLGREGDLLPLGLTFVQWARASHIKPSALTYKVRNLLICTRTTPDVVGWPLTVDYNVSNDDRGGFGGNKRTLAVTTYGAIQWFGKYVIVSQEEAERAIAEYVVKSRSRVAWPSSSGGLFSPAAGSAPPPSGTGLTQYQQWLASQRWNGR